MRISSEETIAGIPLVSVRNALRRVNDDLFLPEHLGEKVGIAQSRAVALVEALYKADYLERNPRFPEYWKTTIKGNALIMAKVGRPYSRRTAERALEGFLERVGEVNENPEFLYRVKKAKLFGSLLDAKNDYVGDVDVAVDLVPKETDPETHSMLLKARAAKAAAEGRQFGNIVEYLLWGQIEVRRYLKGRSPVLSVHPIEDPILQVTLSKTIYGDRS